MLAILKTAESERDRSEQECLFSFFGFTDLLGNKSPSCQSTNKPIYMFSMGCKFQFHHVIHL